MSKNNNNGREYTVDEILAEYGGDRSDTSKVETDISTEDFPIKEIDTAEEILAVNEPDIQSDFEPIDSETPIEDESMESEESIEVETPIENEPSIEIEVFDEEIVSAAVERFVEDNSPLEENESAVEEPTEEIPTETAIVEEIPSDEISDTDTEETEPHIPEEISDKNNNEDYTVKPILGDVKPVDTFKTDKVDKDVAQLFSDIERNAVEKSDDDDLISVEEIQSEIWAEGMEISADDTDERAFKDDIIEEEATPEEISAEKLPEEETVEIFPDEPHTEENSEDVSDENSEDAPLENENPQSDLIDITAENPQNKFLAFVKGVVPWKGDSIVEIIRKSIFIVAICVFIGAGVMLISTLIQSKKAQKDLESIKEVVTTTVATTIDSDGNVVTVAPTKEEELEHNFNVMAYYKDINEDVKAFIELEGCDIFQPVVQAEDNDYYLTHTYYDGTNKAGAIFLDYRCRIEEDYVSPNLVVYGHNQEDGTMFGNLKDYKEDLDFYANNPAITFNTEYEVGTYLIYGYFVTNVYANQDSNGEVFHYQDYIETMADEYTFNWYLKEVQERNYIVSPVDVEYGDKLLCLSTCSNEFSNSRFVVFARKLREGESVEDYDFTKAYFNPYARGVDWDAILSGETTTEVTLETEETEETEETTVTEVPEETEETTQVPETSVTEETLETEATEETEETTTVTSPVITSPHTTPRPIQTETTTTASERVEETSAVSESVQSTSATEGTTAPTETQPVGGDTTPVATEAAVTTVPTQAAETPPTEPSGSN